MPRELITLQVGQCGNQVGSEFWRKVCREHGLGMDGKMTEGNTMERVVDRKQVLFNEADERHEQRWVPRAVLIDMEPGVINGIKKSDLGSVFHDDNMWVHPGMAGAGNNWAKGYAAGADCKHRVADSILEMIQHEAESADSLEGFFFCHSIAGGTGSGLGSFLLERLHDEFPKQILQTYSVFPNQKQSSDVVVQPYNSLLTLNRLITQTDSCVVLDNTSLDRILADRLQVAEPSFTHSNQLVSTVMSASTATLRFPGHSNTNLANIVATLNPIPMCKFISPSFEPLYVEGQGVATANKTTVSGILRRLALPRNWMVTCDSDIEGSFISLVHILQGEVKLFDVHNAIQRFNRREMIHWIPGPYKFYNVAVARNSPFIDNPPKVSGVSLANHTSIGLLMKSILSQFDRLYKRKAFLNQFEDELANRDEFEQSRQTALDLISEYERVHREGLSSD